MDVTPKANKERIQLDLDVSESEQDDVASQASKGESISTEPSLPDSVSESMLTMGITSTQEQVVEVEAKRLQQRQKQIDLGKDTIGYFRYSQMVPRFVHLLFANKLGKREDAPIQRLQTSLQPTRKEHGKEQ
jgi:hypothetical protein